MQKVEAPINSLQSIDQVKSENNLNQPLAPSFATKYSSSRLLLLLFTIIIFLLVFIVFLTYQSKLLALFSKSNTTLPPSPVPSPSLTLLLSPTETKNKSTSDWLTYSNDTYHFSLQMPADTEVSAQPETGSFAFAPSLPDTQEMEMWVDFKKNPDSLTAKEFYQQEYAQAEQAAARGERIPPFQAQTAQELTIQGQSAYIITGIFAGDGSYQHTYIAGKEYLADFYFYEDTDNPNFPNNDKFLPIFQHMIESFQFTY